MSGLLQTFYHGTSRSQALGILVAGLHPNYSESKWEDPGLQMRCTSGRAGMMPEGRCSCWNCHLRGRSFITPNHNDALCYGRTRAEWMDEDQIAVIRFVMPEPQKWVADSWQPEALAVEEVVPARFIAEVQFFSRGRDSLELLESHVVRQEVCR